MAARPSAFRASRTARWGSTAGTTPTGQGSRSTRRDAGRVCGDPPRRFADTPDRKTSATGRRPRSRRRSSGRTIELARRLGVRSRSQRSSAHRRSTCARPRRASLPPLLERLRVPVPALGGSDPPQKAMALERDRQAIAFSERHRRGFRFGNTIAFQTRSHRLAWEAHSASDNFLPLAISAATLALSGRPEASVLRIDRTAGSSRG